MINGESYKGIVAEAAKAALEITDEPIIERVLYRKARSGQERANRIAAAVGFSVRENKVYVFKAKAMIVACGGAVNVFRPRSTGEGYGQMLVSSMERRFRLCTLCRQSAQK